MNYDLTTPKELTEYRKILDIARKGTSYRILNGKDVLWLPIQVPQRVSVIQMLEDLFVKYKKLTRRYDSFTQIDIKFVDNICETIILVLNEYLTGDVIKAYELFSGMMGLYGEDSFPYKDVEDDILFYRMRRDMDKNEEKDFYHLPTTMRDKCSSERFSISGYPCFYLGYSKNDCLVEISKTGSMIGMKLNEKGSLKVLDLTFTEEQESGDQLIKYLRAFPLIASCYVVMNCIDTEKVKFREEYVIPQMLTSYLKHRKKYDGICYYSVRNENLHPLGREENDYRNLVLFPTLTSSEEYDIVLMKKFHWFKPFNVR